MTPEETALRSSQYADLLAAEKAFRAGYDACEDGVTLTPPRDDKYYHMWWQGWDECARWQK